MSIYIYFRYSTLLANHPYVILLLVSFVCTTLSVLSFTMKPFPDFTDPLMVSKTDYPVYAHRHRIFLNFIEGIRVYVVIVTHPYLATNNLAMNVKIYLMSNITPENSFFNYLRYECKIFFMLQRVIF